MEAGFSREFFFWKQHKFFFIKTQMPDITLKIIVKQVFFKHVLGS